MIKTEEKYPDCFGDLETVFPKAEDGLRNTPGTCLPCPHKTPCLRTAVSGPQGHKVRNEMIDRAYDAGRITFWERWSKKKEVDRKSRMKTKTDGLKPNR